MGAPNVVDIGFLVEWIERHEHGQKPHRSITLENISARDSIEHVPIHGLNGAICIMHRTLLSI
ncbi:MAG: hypothetical protein JNM70_00310 [Anaerolineae bacterium]|nr:hypothetical protein [Anaerolineae bacterium]